MNATKKIVAAAIFSLLQSGMAQALESDQFMVLEKELKDISVELNEHVNETVEKTLNWANKKGADKYECEDLQKKAVKKFRGFIVHKIEHWLETEHGQDIYPAVDVGFSSYYKDSIYEWRNGWLVRFFPMGRNLRVGDVYLGADKLAHFFSTGLRYHDVYRKALKKGLSTTEAYAKAIDYGVRLEKTILGYWPIGIFSFGDLEANFQGLLFNENFCRGEVPYLTKDQEGWKLQRKIDLQNYINPYYDETFNPSYFMNSKWRKIKGNFSEICSIFDKPVVAERMKLYQSQAKPSFSVNYLEQKMLDSGGKTVPDRKERNSLWSTCPSLLGE
jgi:hypothetical protein